ncbi:MAG: hypothetical protein PHF18_05660 [Methanosarcina sp.]|nr:hypothetical protein [Methanosarcina sp.]MDD3246326.1 hypothetical protein [Methanosarcina sp.]
MKKAFPDSSFLLGDSGSIIQGDVPVAAKVIKQLEVIVTDRAD